MIARALCILGIVLLTVACGGTDDGRTADDDGTSASEEATAGASPTTTSGGAAPGEADLVATLGGDANLEGGCAWLTPADESAATAGEERFEPQWPPGYRIAFEPLRLHGPDGEVVAEEGDTVRVRGEIAEDVLTVCQVGPVFQVTEVLGGSG